MANPATVPSDVNDHVSLEDACSARQSDAIIGRDDGCHLNNGSTISSDAKRFGQRFPPSTLQFSWMWMLPVYP